MTSNVGKILVENWQYILTNYYFVCIDILFVCVDHRFFQLQIKVTIIAQNTIIKRIYDIVDFLSTLRKTELYVCR